MGDKTLERAYKIISIETVRKEVDEARVDVAWPVLVISVSLPLNQDEGNVFDALVLGLAKAGITDTDDVADVSCLDRNFIYFVQCSLRDRGLLSSRMEITNAGIHCVPVDNVAKDTEAFVLQDRIGGKVLPFVGLTTPSYIQSDSAKDHKLSFDLGTQGKPRTVKARMIYYQKTMPDKVNEEGIRSAYKEFKRRCRKVLSSNGNNQIPRLARGRVSIGAGAEEAYLHCSASMKRGLDLSVVMSDGVTGEYSSLLSRELRESRNIDDITNYLKNALLQNAKPRSGSQSGASNGVSTDVVSVDARDKGAQKGGRQRDSADRPIADDDVSAMVNKAAGKAAKWTRKDKDGLYVLPQNSNEANERQGNFAEAIKELYVAIENALVVCVKCGDAEELYQLMENGSTEDNAAIGKGLAANVGFKMDKGEDSLFASVPPGKISAALEGKQREMQPLLLLALAQGSVDKRHPINILAVQFSDCLTFLRDIKRCRDRVMHGGSDTDFVPQQMSSLLRRTRKMVSVLLNANVEEKTAYNAFDTAADRTQCGFDWERDVLKPSMALDRVFGAIVMQRIKPEWKDLLLSMEAAYEAVPQDISGFVQEGASLLQCVIRDVYTRYRKIGAKMIDIVATSEERARGAHLLPNDGKMPVVLATVSAKHTMSAARGGNGTLGAALLVLLAGAEDDVLMQLGHDEPNIIDVVAAVAERRGHGSSIKQEGSVKEMRDGILGCVKKLEVIYG